jgi:hypothetical protein
MTFDEYKHSYSFLFQELTHITLGRRMNILITRSFNPLAEQLDENKGYRRHKSEMFRQSSNLRGCVAAKLRPSWDP